MKSLRRTVQCKKCPWKKDTNPFEIPDSYCDIKHENLRNTIANPSEVNVGGNLNAMACHESDIGKEDYCIGWLNNQLSVGNNIGLRIQMMHYKNAKDIKVIGDQHKTFEETLPKKQKL
jgi:hypothetical protein